MEDWELDFEWLRVRHVIKDRFNKEVLPDLNAVLFIIGIQELGRWQKEFSKEEKQDLMHVATCRLLSEEGYYEFVGRDADGWPHWQLLNAVRIQGAEEQERKLRELAVRYFQALEQEAKALDRQAGL